MRPAHLALLLAAARLAGCAIAPQPPPASTLQAPIAWRTPAATAADVDPHWWRRFGDPVLDGLVERAIAHNADLRIAAARVAEYRARVDIADAAHWPAFGASAGLARNRARTAAGGFADSTVYQLGVQASYEVDLWGRIARLGDAAAADLQGQQAARDAAALSVAATVGSGYFNLRGLDAQLALAQATLRSRDESLLLARRLFDVGYNSRLEWVQADAEQHNAAATVSALQRTIAQQENALQLLLGDNPGAVPRGTALDGLVPPPTAAMLPSTLLRRRPDIAQAEFKVASADASLAAARDQLLPSLQLSASATLQGLSLHQLLDTPYTLWSVGGSVLAPLLQGRRLQAGTEVAAALRDQAVIAYEQTVRTAFGEVDNGLSAIASLQQQAGEAGARASAAAAALRIARNRYRNGYATYLEELDAQRSSYAADQVVIQLRAALLAAHVDLYRALGGGWGPASPAAG